MRSRIPAVSWLLLVLGFTLGWYAGQGRVPLLGERGIEARVGEALREPDTLLRFERLARVLRGVTKSNQAEAFAGLEANRVGISESDLDVVIHALTRVDPEAALERVKSWPPRGDRMYALREVLYAWALDDPGKAALVYDDQFSKSNDAFELQRSLVAGWARSPDREGVVEYVSKLDAPVPRQELVTEIAQARLKDGGTKAVMRWAESVSSTYPEDFRRDVFAKAARAVALEAPAEAADWVEPYALKNEAPTGVIRVVGMKWSDEDPQAAFHWARALPEQAERTMVLRQAFREMLRKDAAAAESWIRETQLGPGDDAIVETYAQWLSRDRPKDAIDWAGRIQGEKDRIRTLAAVGRVWHSRDPEAAVAWLDQSGLPEDARKAVLEPLKQRRAPGAMSPLQAQLPTPGAGADVR